MKPSTSTGRRCAAAPSTAPAIMAISQPPNSDSTVARLGRGAARGRARERGALARHAGLVLAGAGADAFGRAARARDGA